MSWSEEHLGDLIRLHYGKALKQPDRVEGGEFPVFGASGRVGSHNQATFLGPSLIVGRKGSVGEVTYAESSGWVIDTAFYAEVLDARRLDLRYLYHALVRARLGTKAITTSIPGLNRDDAYQTPIPLPPLSEQKRIAAILDKAEGVASQRTRRVHQLGKAHHLRNPEARSRPSRWCAVRSGRRHSGRRGRGRKGSSNEQGYRSRISSLSATPRGPSDVDSWARWPARSSAT